ncbi:uncharacterized protein E5676_scaffold455G001580 [Cucumis melo var. makuwa]|uniref:Uncharacterized protein n=1 Tax=Cucumis melo var. makuwa TaxID=1194695 RepID=A0A5D3E5L0_CUCMM|nr:uncharacterized protein E6C27_scaffold285G002770 [Cucumis melo var. makuwa]TYK30936.1 uncharacterized protein E5676_scaffold455G001580 [Cucumis melo var. makuwa]
MDSKVVVVFPEEIIAHGVKMTKISRLGSISRPVASRSRIPMEWWTEAGLAAMASAIGKPLTFNLATKERYRTVESKVQQEEAVCEVVPNKGDEPTSMACGDVELKSFTQLEEGEIKGSSARTVAYGVSPNRPISHVESLLKMGEGDNWALSIVDGSLPLLQVVK